MTTLAKFHRWSDIPLEELNPLLKRQFVSGEQGTIAHIHLKKGCIVPTHVHHNEQFSAVISGAMRFTLNPGGDAEVFDLGPGDLLIIPGNVPHMAQALEDTLNLDVFTPVREDWESGNDAYLRR
ncbi:MAG TPA: cupin domain-containing protein [Acidobacteriaceae bacterium]|nr:cupin domain-containing protein [Acidobacteriaceae bacterium]